MTMLWQTSETKPRAFSGLIRPLVYLGAGMGVFPYSDTRDAAKTHTKEASEVQARYRLTPLSFPFFLAVVWVFLFIFSTGIGRFEEPFEGKDSVKFYEFMNVWITYLYAFTYVSAWVMLFQCRRMERCQMTLAQLDNVIPSRGTSVIVVQVLFIVFISTSLVDSVLKVITGDTINNIGSGVVHVVITMYMMVACYIYTFLLWSVAVHLADKFEVVTSQLQVALAERDCSQLQDARMKHYNLRLAVEEVEELLWPSVAMSYFLAMFTTCMSWTVLCMRHTFTTLPIQLYLLIVEAFTIFIVLILTHYFPARCSRKANQAVKQLCSQDCFNDDFSRQVSSFRAELSSSRVVFTVAGLVDLDMQELWRELQFMVTVAVVLVQFSMDSSDNVGARSSTNDSTLLNTTYFQIK